MTSRALFSRTFVAGLVGVLFLGVSTGVQGATITHNYDLNGTLADSLGGPSLVSHGGTLNATNYSFGANQGLSLSNGLLNSADYSIELNFQFSTVSGFRKILDFKNLASDNGLYNLSTAVNYFNFDTGPTGALAPNTPVDVVLTRNAATGQVVAYADGVQQISFTDSTSDAVFNAPANIINFFMDDNVTGSRESSAGLVDRIRIYDGSLTAAEVAALAGGTPPGGGGSNPVPLPVAVWAGVAMGTGIMGRRIVRKK